MGGLKLILQVAQVLCVWARMFCFQPLRKLLPNDLELEARTRGEDLAFAQKGAEVTLNAGQSGQMPLLRFCNGLAIPMFDNTFCLTRKPLFQCLG